MKRIYFAVQVLFVLCLLTVFSARADTLSTREYAVTATGSWETMPRLGNDGLSDLVVFTKIDLLPDGTASKGDIWYQRLAAGAPLGAAVQVTSNAQDNQLNDVSGDYIVYTAYDSKSSLSGRIMVYQISTTNLYVIGSALVIQEPRISGSKVVWREGGSAATMVMIYDLSWLGTARGAEVLAGPIPPTYTVDIGDRFVVWAELTNGQYDLVAYELFSGTRADVTATPSTFETEPSTSGAWVVWQAQDKGVTASRIVARNLDTAEERVIADSNVYNYQPSISGDLIAWESMLNGNRDIFVHRLSTHETFTVTSDPADQYLNDMFGQSVAYVDERTGTSDIYVSDLTFVTSTPCNALNLPAPVLAYKGTEVYTGSDGNLYDRYRLTVNNRLDYPAEIFLAAPYMPPCGTNTDSSRTWIDVYNGDTGTRIYGFCALSSPADLDNIWFGLPAGSIRPGKAFITLIDRLCNSTSTSNLVTINTPPVAYAGPDQLITELGNMVQLDGTKSYDEEGDVFTYQWSMIGKPAGSSADMSNSASSKPTFIADVQGAYTVRLVVSDPWASGAPDDVVVSFLNVKPVANAGSSQSAIAGDTVTLNGSGSSDANGDPLTFQWSFASIPAGSMSVVSSPTTTVTTFVPDLPGLYIARLIVNDGYVNSDPSTVQVQVITSQSAAINTARDLETLIASLSPDLFKNPNMSNALINKLNAVIASISNGNYSSALDQLQNDILGKTDGCANGGSPDKNDWIKTCEAQNQIYPLVIQTIELVRSLM